MKEKKAYIKLDNGLLVEVIVKGKKNSYGRERFIISPVAGEGEVVVQDVIIK